MKNKLLSNTELYTEAKKRLDELIKTRTIVKKNFANHPEGIIYYHKRGAANFQFDVRESSKDRKGKYLSVSETGSLKKYFQKKYDDKIEVLLSTEIVILEDFLKKTDSIVEKIREVYSLFPNDLKKYITPIDMSDKDYSSLWEAIPFQPKGLDRKTDLFTEKGEEVRSKTELNIANMLFKMGIPYKYECPFKLADGTIIHPDFTVLDVKSRNELFWEHRGMMDDRDYARHAVKRIKDYEQNGIFPGDRLIITEETLSNQLGISEISRIIKHYFPISR